MRGPVLLLALLLGACAGQPATNNSLYQQLGGEPGITRIVEGMLLRTAEDPRIVEHFQNVDIQRVRDKLVEQVCVAQVCCTRDEVSISVDAVGVELATARA